MECKLKLLVMVWLLSGCALKQYPQSNQLSAVESSALDCPALNDEIAKSHAVQQEIDRTGSFDALTVLGFVGDFGIGNGIAKHRATEQAQERLQQLEKLKQTRCPLTS